MKRFLFVSLLLAFSAFSPQPGETLDVAIYNFITAEGENAGFFEIDLTHEGVRHLRRGGWICSDPDAVLEVRVDTGDGTVRYDRETASENADELFFGDFHGEGAIGSVNGMRLDFGFVALCMAWCGFLDYIDISAKPDADCVHFDDENQYVHVTGDFVRAE